MDNALQGSFERLGERELGIELFGKEPGFDTGRDSTVRVAASDVRSRLLRCYTDPDAPSDFRIELPAGSYIPEFHRPEVAVTQVAPQPLHQHAISNTVTTQVPAYWRWLALALSLFPVIIGVGWWSNSSSESAKQTGAPWSAELDEIWQPFINTRKPLLITVGNPLFAQFEDKTIYRHPSIEKWDDLKKSIGDRQARPVYYYSAVGDVTAAFLLGQRLGPHQRNISIVRSSQMLWQQMADSNVLLIGPPRFFADRMASMPVTFEITESPEGFRVSHPKSGEADLFAYRDQSAYLSEDGKATVLVTHAPGPVGNTDVANFASNSTFGRVGAVEAFTDPVFVRNLAVKMRGDSNHFPRYFQVLLTVSYKGGVPTETSYVLHRELVRRPM